MKIKLFPYGPDDLPGKEGITIVLPNRINFKYNEILEEFKVEDLSKIISTDGHNCKFLHVTTVCVGDGIEYDGKYYVIESTADLLMVMNDLKVLNTLNQVQDSEYITITEYKTCPEE